MRRAHGAAGIVGTQERKSDPTRPLRAAARAKDGAARVHWQDRAACARTKHTHAPLWTHSLFGCSIHLNHDKYNVYCSEKAVIMMYDRNVKLVIIGNQKKYLWDKWSSFRECIYRFQH